MRTIWTLGAAALLALVLAACTVTIEPTDPFPGATPVTAVDDPNAAVASSSVAANDSEVYVVTVPAGVISGDDLLFFEIDEPALGIVVYSSAGSAIASSNSEEFFVRGAAAVSLLEPAGIGITVPCRGPCVLLPAAAGTYYVEIVNDSGSNRNFDLYIFGDDFVDEDEPANDSSASALPVSAGGVGQGAIETLGDNDYYSMSSSGNLEFTAPGSPLDLRAEVSDSGGVVATLQPGDPAFAVFAGDIVRVYEAGGDAAGPSATSNYTLSLTSSPFSGAEPISAGTDPGTATDSGTLAGGGTKVYDVSVSGGAATSELLYFELNTEDAAIVVYNSGGTALASSTSAERFSAGDIVSSRFSTTAINPSFICRGPCVIFEASAGSYFVEVINKTGSNLSYQLYVYGDVYQDSNEPGNDVPAGGPSLGNGESDSGGIETLGDEDYFNVSTGGVVALTSSTSIQLRADIIDGSGAVQDTISPGQTTVVLAGERIRVYELGGDAAGPAGNSGSGYTIAIN